jgi:hypothetical protein
MKIQGCRKPPHRGFNQDMKFDYTFIERGQNGSVVNSDFETFDSFQQCCTTAEERLATKPLKRVDIVPCEYDADRCHPHLISVLKTFK